MNPYWFSADTWFLIFLACLVVGAIALGALLVIAFFPSAPDEAAPCVHEETETDEEAWGW
jgi:hypothetical protein